MIKASSFLIGGLVLGTSIFAEPQPIMVDFVRNPGMETAFPNRLELFSCKLNLSKFPEAVRNEPAKFTFFAQNVKTPGTKIPVFFRATAYDNAIFYWKSSCNDAEISWRISAVPKQADTPEPIPGYGERLHTDKLGEIRRAYSQKVNLIDWNNDGKLDLFIGDITDGVRFYFNNGGTKVSEMSFNADAAQFLLDDKGKKIVNTDGGLPNSSPAIGDFNNDGKPDLVIGTKWQRRLNVYINIGSKENPILKHSATIEGQRGFPEIGDWNGDGKNDILIAPTGKMLKLYVALNLGDGKWDEFKEVFKDDKVNSGKASNFSPVITFADLDGDGLNDLIITTPDSSYFYRNSGSKTMPEFADRINLKPYGVPGMSYCALAVVDWDGDGKKDLVSAYGILYLNRGTTEKMKFVFKPVAFPSTTPQELDLSTLYHVGIIKNASSLPLGFDVYQLANGEINIYKCTPQGFIPSRENLPRSIQIYSFAI